jgi:hypothetical protein
MVPTGKESNSPFGLGKARPPMLKPREIDEYLLPTERRVRMRQHWAALWRELILTALFVLTMVTLEGYLPDGIATDNLTFYLALVAVVRFTVLALL